MGIDDDCFQRFNRARLPTLPFSSTLLLPSSEDILSSRLFLVEENQSSSSNDLSCPNTCQNKTSAIYFNFTSSLPSATESSETNMVMQHLLMLFSINMHQCCDNKLPLKYSIYIMVRLNQHLCNRVSMIMQSILHPSHQHKILGLSRNGAM